MNKNNVPKQFDQSNTPKPKQQTEFLELQTLQKLNLEHLTTQAFLKAVHIKFGILISFISEILQALTLIKIQVIRTS